MNEPPIARGLSARWSAQLASAVAFALALSLLWASFTLAQPSDGLPPSASANASSANASSDNASPANASPRADSDSAEHVASESKQGASQQHESTSRFTVGVDGRSRSGLWTYCQCNQTDLLGDGQMSVATLDGDGVRVRYELAISGGSSQQCTFQASRNKIPIDVSIRDAEGKSIDNVRLDGPELIPFEQPWIVALGDSLGIDHAIEQQGRRNAPVVSLLQADASLPADWIGYSGVDLVIVAGSHIDQLNAMPHQQQQALADWVRQGGHILLTLGGESLGALASESWLIKHLQLPLTSAKVTFDPRAIESYAVTQSPLPEFPGLRLPRDSGRVLLSARTTDRQTVPVAAEYRVGFGWATVIAADLDREPFAQWPDRQKLLERFLPHLLMTSHTRPHVPRADTGYTDMAGQLRRSLDRFASHWVLPFKWLAGFMIAYLALIGPLDYWIVNRWLGRPILGWITFPTLCIAFGLMAYFGARTNSASAPLANQFSIVDLDPSNSYGRGFVWSQVLSAQAGLNDAHYTTGPSFSGSENQQTVTGWWGIGSDEFGGLASTRREDQLPAYQFIRQTAIGDLTGTAIQALPMATGSTKGLAARWQFPCNLAMDSDLRQRRGTDLIGGRLQNPLPIDLQNPILVYRGWIYLLPTRLGAKRAIADVGLIQPKNLKWRLARRTVGDEAAASQAWNPSDVSDLERVIEILMFYETAGGVKYTQLSNHVLGHLDLSRVLNTDCAMLIGKIESPAASLRFTTTGDDATSAGNDTANEIDLGKQDSYVRILVPVQTSSNASSHP